ncbi:MAG: hypothetical protein JXR96_30770 [Deltaproteobacteria bacterium]|nr:hypothetical protein [Deltaproteobacteria bacterium]
MACGERVDRLWPVLLAACCAVQIGCARVGFGECEPCSCDCGTPDDGGCTIPRSCEELFPLGPEDRVCLEGGTFCRIYVMTDGASCRQYCRSAGQQCLVAMYSRTETPCIITGVDTCDESAWDQVCVCSRDGVPGDSCQEHFPDGLVCEDHDGICEVAAWLAQEITCREYCENRGVPYDCVGLKFNDDDPCVGGQLLPDSCDSMEIGYMDICVCERR